MGILFILCGLISLGVTAGIFYIYQIFFLSDVLTLSGKVVDIVTNEHVSKDALGHVNDVTETKDPIIEFLYQNKYYRFETSNIYLKPELLTIGTTVKVVINEKKYPNVAKLAEEASNYKIFMLIFGLLGMIFTVVGIFLIDFDNFISSLSDPFTLITLGGGLFFLFMTLKKCLTMIQNVPMFATNITEVNNKKN